MNYIVEPVTRFGAIYYEYAAINLVAVCLEQICNES